MDISMNGEQINITANPADEYWEYITINHQTVCECYTLYMVSVSSLPPIYDNISFSNYYGIGAVMRSFIPGWGQLYKGNKIKGFCIMGGEVACITCIVVAENLRSSYIRKIKEQPQYTQVYSSKSNNYKNIRNVCIGTATAIYVYNLIDAAVAKGAKRIIVKPYRSVRFSMVPAIMDKGIGIGLTLNF